MAVKINENESYLLNSIRGWSAIAVLVAHTLGWFVLPYNQTLETTVYVFSSAAVMLFFALSGFFITGAITNNITKNGRFIFKPFLTDRFARLVPVLIIAVLITIVAYQTIIYFDLTCSTACQLPHHNYAEREIASLKPQNIIGSLFFLNGLVYGLQTPSMNGPLWSLSHEFWFYILAATIAVFFTAKKYSCRILAGCLFVIFIYYCYRFELYSFLAGLAIWLIGGKTYLDRTSQKSPNKYLYAALSLLFAGFSYAAFTSGLHIQGRYLLGLALAFIFYLIFSNPEKLKERKVGFLEQTSKCSYTLYAIHWPIIQFTYALTITSYDQWSRAAQITFVVALLISTYAISRFLSIYAENTSLFYKAVESTKRYFSLTFGMKAHKIKNKSHEKISQ